MKSERLAYIDNIKGIGILLVLIGHIFPRDVVKPIFLFHMPLFFFLSGYLLSPQIAKNFNMKKVRTLLIPYVSFLFLLTTLDVIQSIIFNGFSLTTIASFYGRAIYGGAMLTGDFGAYWFVTTLFFSLVFINWAINNIPKRLLVAIVVIMYILSFVNQYFLKDVIFPLGINICLQAVPVIYLGYIARHNQKLMRLMSLAGIPALILYVTVLTGAMDTGFKYTLYGIPVLNTLLSMTLIYVVYFLSKKMQGVNTLVLIGSASMTIMFTHQWIHFHLIKLGLNNPYIILALTLLMSLTCHLVLMKTKTGTRFFLGQRQQPAQL